MLDLPRGTVNSRLRRALDRLSGLLGGCAEGAELREALLDARVPDSGMRANAPGAGAGRIPVRAAGAGRPAAVERRRCPPAAVAMA